MFRIKYVLLHKIGGRFVISVGKYIKYSPGGTVDEKRLSVIVTANIAQVVPISKLFFSVTLRPKKYVLWQEMLKMMYMMQLHEFYKAASFRFIE